MKNTKIIKKNAKFMKIFSKTPVYDFWKIFKKII